MTVPGIMAHQSALKDGETRKIPQFDARPPDASGRLGGTAHRPRRRWGCTTIPQRTFVHRTDTHVPRLTHPTDASHRQPQRHRCLRQRIPWSGKLSQHQRRRRLEQLRWVHRQTNPPVGRCVDDARVVMDVPLVTGSTRLGQRESVQLAQCVRIRTWSVVKQRGTGVQRRCCNPQRADRGGLLHKAGASQQTPRNLISARSAVTVSRCERASSGPTIQGPHASSDRPAAPNLQRKNEIELSILPCAACERTASVGAALRG